MSDTQTFLPKPITKYMLSLLYYVFIIKAYKQKCQSLKNKARFNKVNYNLLYYKFLTIPQLTLSVWYLGIWWSCDTGTHSASADSFATQDSASQRCTEHSFYCISPRKSNNHLNFPQISQLMNCNFISEILLFLIDEI